MLSTACAHCAIMNEIFGDSNRNDGFDRFLYIECIIDFLINAK